MKTTCNNCSITFKTEIKFCPQCGNAILKSRNEKRVVTLNQIITFYVSFLVFATFSYFMFDAYEDNLAVEITIETVFALLVFGFCFLDYKNILKLFRFSNIPWYAWLFAVVFPIFSSFVVYFFVEFINVFIFEEASLNYFINYLYLDNPLAWAILFVAILPPIFEELAFRGFLFNKLKEVSSNRVTIIGTAFIFALVHFSFLSFLWIFPFGIVLGYLRSKYNSLWIGMIIHFIHNFIVLMIDYYLYLYY